jgi:hypothetical protein
VEQERRKNKGWATQTWDEFEGVRSREKRKASDPVDHFGAGQEGLQSPGMPAAEYLAQRRQGDIHRPRWGLGGRWWVCSPRVSLRCTRGCIPWPLSGAVRAIYVERPPCVPPLQGGKMQKLTQRR